MIIFLSSDPSKTGPDDTFLDIISDIDTAGVISLFDNNHNFSEIYQKIKEVNLLLITVNRSNSELSDVSVF
jgi:hypothetical protein